MTLDRVKPSNEKLSELLKPLQHPNGPWSSPRVNFITSLPRCEGFNSIMLVVDNFTKMADFFPYNSPSRQRAHQKCSPEKYSLVTVCPRIMSDCGPQFLSKLWNNFLKGLYIKTCISSGYHPRQMIIINDLILYVKIKFDALCLHSKTTVLCGCNLRNLPTTTPTFPQNYLYSKPTTGNNQELC